MRLPTMVMCVLMVAAPALGASHKEHDDCNADDPDRNIAGCTRIVEDDHESTKVRSIAYVARGLAWRNRGDRDRAMADFTDAIRLDPDSSLAYSNRGILWREKKDIDRAIADFTDAIRIEALPKSDSQKKAEPKVAESPHKIEIPLPSDRDMDRVMSFLEQAWRRLVEMANRMQKDVSGRI